MPPKTAAPKKKPKAVSEKRVMKKRTKTSADERSNSNKKAAASGRSGSTKRSVDSDRGGRRRRSSGGKSASVGKDRPSVPPTKRIEDERHYHGMLPRADVNLLLKRQGDFLMRTTQKHEGGPKEAALSVMWDNKVRHIIPSTTTRGTVCIERLEFKSMVELVNYYWMKKVALKNNCPWMLVNAVVRQDWELAKDKIRLDKKLGSGAFGDVYRGTMSVDGGAVAVAVKQCHGETMTKATLGDFMKEARMMRQYEHKNVVRFYGIVVESEPVMMVMELVNGGALDAFLQEPPKRVTVTPGMRLHFCLDAAKGLEYLHSKKCMHRDVAARNCLVNDGVVKISDFGLCREESMYKMNPKKRVPIRWLSPETLGSAIYTFKSDVFSYGVLVWEIYTDAYSHPYPELETIDVQRLVKNGYRMVLPPEVPIEVREIVNECWQEDQDRRATFAQVVHHLVSANSQQHSSNS